MLSSANSFLHHISVLDGCCWAPRYKDELVKEKTRLEVAVKNLGTGTNFLWACLSFLLSFILVKSPWKTFLIQPNFIFYYLFSSGWKNEIIFCITNEISFTIISLSSSDKFFLVYCWLVIKIKVAQEGFNLSPTEL